MSRNPVGAIMRSFLLAFGIMLSVGCAAVVNGRGIYLPDVKTREQVHQVFGKPAEVGEQDGNAFEEFRTHRKLSQAWMGEYFLFADLETLFLIEFYAFPRELWRAGRQHIMGQTLRFTYDSEGNVDHVTTNGNPFLVLAYPNKLPDRTQHTQNAEAMATKVVCSGAAK